MTTKQTPKWRAAEKLPLKKLPAIVLKNGAHGDRSNGLCAMEAVAWLAGEEHSDRPECASPAIAAFMRSWNDGLPSDADRERLLRPLLPKLLNTNTHDKEVERRIGILAQDWYVRVHAPAFLDLAGHVEEAKALREFAPIRSHHDLKSVQPILDRANKVATAASTAAWSAARLAARSAASTAAESAARSAAWSAAESAAWSAAWSAASTAAESAASTAADAKMKSTVATLQESATDLVLRMVAETKRGSEARA